MKTKIIACLFFIGLLNAGCKKGLDLLPTDSVTEEVAFNSVAALQKGLNTVYTRYSGARVNTAYANSITSDETKFGPDNGGSGQFGYRLQYTSSTNSNPEVTDMFVNYYATIDMANRVLAASEKVSVAGALE